MPRPGCKLVDGCLVYQGEVDYFSIKLSPEQLALMDKMNFSDRDELMAQLGVVADLLSGLLIGMINASSLAGLTVVSLVEAMELVQQMLLQPPSPNGLIVVDDSHNASTAVTSTAPGAIDRVALGPPLL